MKPPKCDDCPYRYDAPEEWEVCMECVDDEDQEVEVPGTADEDVILVADDVVDSLAYADVVPDIYDVEE